MTTNDHEPKAGLHVAIIMDGNGRWATSRGLPRVAGHRAGVAALRRTVERAPALGITLLTVYAFSSDNWGRPASEVESIFVLLRTFLRLESVRLQRQHVRLQVIGRRDRLPASVLREIERAELVTQDGQRLCLRVAIDYSSRGTIAHTAMEAVLSSLNGGRISRDDLEPRVRQALTSQGRDVDLLVRTGGEQRLSDFLLWECSYAELLFTATMWPDFGGDDLASAVSSFQFRQRRFGALPTVAACASNLSSACI